MFFLFRAVAHVNKTDLWEGIIFEMFFWCLNEPDQCLVLAANLDCTVDLLPQY